MKSREKKSRSIRTCLVCGVKKHPGELKRFTWNGECPTEDDRKKKQGRGAYCCTGKECHEKLISNSRLWGRAFRLKK